MFNLTFGLDIKEGGLSVKELFILDTYNKEIVKTMRVNFKQALVKLTFKTNIFLFTRFDYFILSIIGLFLTGQLI